MQSRVSSRHARKTPPKLRFPKQNGTKLWIPNRRQRLALEAPQVHRNFRDPRFRKVMMCGPLTYRDPQSGELRPEIQFATALSVQMEAPPIWYLHCCFVHQPTDFIFPVSAYADWMADLVNAAVEQLLPDSRKREFYADTYEHSMVFRMPLTTEERLMVARPEKIEYWQS